MLKAAFREDTCARGHLGRKPEKAGSFSSKNKAWEGEEERTMVRSNCPCSSGRTFTTETANLSDSPMASVYMLGDQTYSSDMKPGPYRLARVSRRLPEPAVADSDLSRKSAPSLEQGAGPGESVLGTVRCQLGGHL